MQMKRMEPSVLKHVSLLKTGHRKPVNSFSDNSSEDMGRTMSGRRPTASRLRTSAISAAACGWAMRTIIPPRIAGRAMPMPAVRSITACRNWRLAPNDKYQAPLNLIHTRKQCRASQDWRAEGRLPGKADCQMRHGAHIARASRPCLSS